MTLNMRSIKAIGFVHIILTVILIGNEIPIPHLAVLGLTIAAFRYSFLDVIGKNFNKLYSWAMIDERLVPTNDISGIDLGHYDYIEAQKIEIKQLQEQSRYSGHFLRILALAVSAYIILKDMFADHSTECIILIIYAVWELGAAYWSNFYYKHLVSVGIVGLFCKFSSPISLLFFGGFAYTYFLLFKFYSQFYYEKLATKTSINTIKIEFPWKSFSIFILSFSILFLLFPNIELPFSPKGLTNKIKDLDKKNQQAREGLQNKVNKHIKKHQISPDKVKQLLQDKNLSKDMINKLEQYQALQNKLKDCFKAIPSGDGSGMTGFLTDKEGQKDFQEWNKLNNEIRDGIAKNNQQQKSLDKLPDTLKNLSPQDLNKLLKTLEKTPQGSPRFASDQELLNKLKANNPGKIPLQEQQEITNKNILKKQEMALEQLKKISQQLSKREKQELQLPRKIKELQQLNQIKDPSKKTKEIQAKLEQINRDLQNQKAKNAIKNNRQLQQEIDKFNLTVKDSQKIIQQEDIKKNFDLNKLSSKEKSRLKEVLNNRSVKEKPFQTKNLEEITRRRSQEEDRENFNESFKNLEINQKEIQDTEKFKGLARQIAVILVLVIGILIFYALKNFFAKDKIIHDEEIKNLDEEIKSEIYSLLSGTKSKFNSIEEEIIYCYELFHEVVNKLFYDNNSSIFSPPPSILDDKESLLSKRLKSIALTLASCYTPIKYGEKQLRYPKELIKKFRNDYKDFLRLSKKLLKA